MGEKQEPAGVVVSASLPQDRRRGAVAVQLTGQTLHLLATGEAAEGAPALDALQAVVSELQTGIDRLRKREGRRRAGGRSADTQILLGRSAIPDPEKLAGKTPVTRYAVPLAEDEIMATAALEFFDDSRRSIVVDFVIPSSEKGPDTNISMRWGLRDEILQEIHEHLGKRFRS